MAAQQDLGASTLASAPAVPATPTSQKTLWLSVAAIATVLATAFILLPNKQHVVAGFTLHELFYIELVFFAAGLTSGLAGFGFSGIGAASLVLFPPVLGTPLLQALSTANQVASVGQLRKDMPRTWSSFWAGPG